jgi:hypothetical protein
MLRHDYVPRHTISGKEVLTKKGFTVVPNPPCSPDPSACDFLLFPKLKFHLIGRYFGTVDNIQKVMTGQFSALPHEDFQHYYRNCEQFFGSVWLPKWMVLIFNSVNKKKKYSTS